MKTHACAATAILLAASMMACAAGTSRLEQPNPERARISAAIDSILEKEVMSRGITGVSLLITNGNGTVLERQLGFADAESKRSTSVDTRYLVGSISKQFTSALVLKQVDRGRIALSDTIGRYVTGLKPAWTGATIEQLLSHTSGLPREFRDPSRIGDNLPTDSLLAMAFRSTAPSLPAGTRFTYSNTGYMVLAALVEKLYGTSYADAVQSEIARPLGLSSLSFGCSPASGTEAVGYMRTPDGASKLAPRMHPSIPLGNGGICSTARDLEKWNRALHGGKVLSAATYAAMTTPRGVAARANVPYGLGLYVRKSADGRPVIVHDGSTVGYNGENIWYPNEKLSLTMLYNSSPSLGADLNLTERMATLVLSASAVPR